MHRFAAPALFVVLLGGCVSIVRPPAAPDDPATVFVVFDAMHKGIALPEEDGTFTEWGYGEWGWYARNEDAWYDAFSTVLWPTRGALGRRALGAVDGAAIRRFRAPAEVVPIVVGKARVDALRDRLSSEWAAGRGEIVENPRYHLTLVPSPRGYWFLHNCNDETADWLRALGCDVSWVPVRLGLTVAAPEAP